MLHSTPAGATVAIDGMSIGATPTVWRAPRDGKKHEFTFFMEGYDPSTYRFFPIKDGVVHGSLKRVRRPKKPSRAQPPRK